MACVCWATGIVPRPKVTVDTLKGIWPLAVVHTLGNLLTNVSLGAVAVRGVVGSLQRCLQANARSWLAVMLSAGCFIAFYGVRDSQAPRRHTTKCISIR